MEALHDFKTSSWSGGTTTELYIYPETAVYAERDFIFRISTATINAAQSVFTSLPDYTRYLATLQNEITLCVNDCKSQLPRRQVFRFEGGDEVKSYGVTTDLNLMVRHGYKGEMLFLPETKAADASAAFDLDTEICFLIVVQECKVAAFYRLGKTSELSQIMQQYNSADFFLCKVKTCA